MTKKPPRSWRDSLLVGGAMAVAAFVSLNMANVSWTLTGGLTAAAFVFGILAEPVVKATRPTSAPQRKDLSSTQGDEPGSDDRSSAT